MNNFTVIYKILKYLEKALDAEEFDENAISAEKLKISQTRLEQLLIMMQNEGYIKGLVIARTLSDTKFHIIEPMNPEITIRGLEYLAENSMMKKAAALLKGAADLIT